jgi:hypothetical protein
MGSPEPESDADSARWAEVETPSIPDWLQGVQKEVGDVVAEGSYEDLEGEQSTPRVLRAEVAEVAVEADETESLPVPESLATSIDLLLPRRGVPSAPSAINAPVDTSTSDGLPVPTGPEVCLIPDNVPTRGFNTPANTNAPMGDLSPCSTNPLADAFVPASTPTPAPATPLPSILVNSTMSPCTSLSSVNASSDRCAGEQTGPSVLATPPPPPPESTTATAVSPPTAPTLAPPAPLGPSYDLAHPTATSPVPSKRRHSPAPVPISRPVGWTVPSREREWDPTWGMEMARKKRRWD